MQDQVLYRKYRPRIWDEVIGQDHIVQTLARSIEQQSFSQAYIFTGSRGTGKTSVARIFARAVGTAEEDIIEIDAASNRGIDDIRALRDAVRVLPFSSRYKVYIIDEVHMLSKDAFNALLKTLEEPPAHVIFMLATTELDKIPETILSRCQVFSFRKPNEKILAAMVQSVADKEGVVIDQESIQLIAFLGDGSFRDTQSILQKVFSTAEGRRVTREQTELVTGAPSLRTLHELYNALIATDMDQCYQVLLRAVAHHTDMMLLAQMLLDSMRASLLYRYAPSQRPLIEGERSAETVSLIVRGAVEGARVINAQSIVSVITAIERSNYAVVASLPLELACIEIIERATTAQ